MEHHLQTSLKSSHHRLHVMAFLIDFLNGAGFVYIKLAKKTFCSFCYALVNPRKSQLHLFLLCTLISPGCVSAVTLPFAFTFGVDYVQH